MRITLDRIAMSAAGLGVDTLPELLRRAFARAVEIAAAGDLESPLRIDLVTSDDRLVLAMTATRDQEGWRTRLESGDFDAREGMPLPWYLVLTDATGRVATIRLELDSPRTQIN